MTMDPQSAFQTGAGVAPAVQAPQGTSWQRLVQAVMEQAPRIAELHKAYANAPTVDILRAMALLAARLEGGAGDEPGIGDGGLSHGWFQFYEGGGVGTELLNEGWTREDFYNEAKVVEYWLPRLSYSYMNTKGSGAERIRNAIFELERPAQMYSNANWNAAVGMIEQEVGGLPSVPEGTYSSGDPAWGNQGDGRPGGDSEDFGGVPPSGETGEVPYAGGAGTPGATEEPPDSDGSTVTPPAGVSALGSGGQWTSRYQDQFDRAAQRFLRVSEVYTGQEGDPNEGEYLAAYQALQTIQTLMEQETSSIETAISLGDYSREEAESLHDRAMDRADRAYTDAVGELDTKVAHNEMREEQRQARMGAIDAESVATPSTSFFRDLDFESTLNKYLRRGGDEPPEDRGYNIFDGVAGIPAIGAINQQANAEAEAALLSAGVQNPPQAQPPWYAGTGATLFIPAPVDTRFGSAPPAPAMAAPRETAAIPQPWVPGGLSNEQHNEILQRLGYRSS